MSEARVGRVLVASLHQAIAELLPQRLAFYENWLHTEGLREGTIGLAPLYAVLSFLRQEGGPYASVMERAGEYAAEWTVGAMRPVHRRAIARLPAFARRRLMLRRTRMLVRGAYGGSRARSRVGRGEARVDIRASVFCAVREPALQPLCVFYAAAARRMLSLFDLDGTASVAACRATGADNCVVSVPFTSETIAEQKEVA